MEEGWAGKKTNKKSVTEWRVFSEGVKSKYRCRTGWAVKYGVPLKYLIILVLEGYFVEFLNNQSLEKKLEWTKLIFN